MEKKRGCCLFLGLHNIRTSGTHYPFISHIPPWHVQQTLGTALCAQNINRREAAGYWQADILLPSPVCRVETRTECPTGLAHMPKSEDTSLSIDSKPITVKCWMEVTLEPLTDDMTDDRSSKNFGGKKHVEWLWLEK